MNADELKARQAPLTAAAQQDPACACLTLVRQRQSWPQARTDRSPSARRAHHPAGWLASGRRRQRRRRLLGRNVAEALIACAGVSPVAGRGHGHGAALRCAVDGYAPRENWIFAAHWGQQGSPGGWARHHPPDI